MRLLFYICAYLSGVLTKGVWQHTDDIPIASVNHALVAICSWLVMDMFICSMCARVPRSGLTHFAAGQTRCTAPGLEKGEADKLEHKRLQCGNHILTRDTHFA